MDLELACEQRVVVQLSMLVEEEDVLVLQHEC